MANRGGARKGAGRPKKVEEQKMLETILEAGRYVTEHDDPYSKLWEGIWRQALEGSDKHQRLVTDYTYGKPKQRIEADIVEIPSLTIVKPND